MTMAAVARAVRYALRLVRRSPAVPLACALALALGVGTAVAVSALVYGVVLRPLPYVDPDRLVQLSARTGDRTLNFSAPEFDDWERRTTAFASLATFLTTPAALSTESETRSVTSAVVSARFFGLLGVRPLLGRFLSPGDERSPVVIISERLWRRHFSAASGAIGKSLTVNDRAVTVMGVAQADFRFPTAEVDVWLPIGYARESGPPQWGMRGFRGFSVLARLDDGASMAVAAADVARVADELAREFPRFNATTQATLTPLRDSLRGSVRTVMLMLLIAAALLLLAICANVFNMLVAHGVGCAAKQRSGSLSVRAI